MYVLFHNPKGDPFWNIRMEIRKYLLDLFCLFNETYSLTEFDKLLPVSVKC